MIVFKNKGNYGGNVLISETRGGAQTSGSERHQGMGADGLALAQIYERDQVQDEKY